MQPMSLTIGLMIAFTRPKISATPRYVRIFSHVTSVVTSMPSMTRAATQRANPVINRRTRNPIAE